MGRMLQVLAINWVEAPSHGNLGYQSEFHPIGPCPGPAVCSHRTRRHWP